MLDGIYIGGMRKQSSKRKKRPDVSELAADIVADGTDLDDSNFQEEKQPDLEGKNPAAVALGRLGGLKGGKARAKKLTPKERSEAARRAALARWNKTPDKEK